MTAREVVDQARDYHISFDPRRVGEKMALRYLSRYQRRLAEKITAMSEEALASTVSFTKAEVDAAALAGAAGAGLTLPDHLILLGLHTTRVAGGSSIPVDLVAYSNRHVDAVRVFPSAYILNQKLYPTNRYEASGFHIKGDSSTLEHGWEPLDGIVAILVRTPVELTAPENLLTLPDSTQDALVANLALWMASRNGVLKELPDLKQEATDAEASAVMTLGSQDTTSTWTVARR